MSSVQSLSESLALSGYSTLLTIDQAVLDAIPTALCICAADGLVKRFNAPAASLLGWASRERHAAPSRSFEIYNANGLHTPFDGTPMAAVLHTGEGQRGKQLLMGREDGTRIFVRVDIEPLRDRGGRVDGAVISLQDLASANDGELSRLFEALPAAIYATDLEGRITFCNHAASEIAGRQPRLGKDRWCISWRLYRPDGTPLPHEDCPMAMALKEGRPIRDVELIAERPDGTRVPIMPFPTPLYDASGAMTGAVNMLVDITELKRAQALSAKRAEEQAALYRFTDRLYRAQSLTDIYDAALGAILGALGCARAAVLLFDEAGVMRFVASRGLSRAYRDAVEGHTPWKTADREAQPIFVADIDDTDESDAIKAAVKAEGVCALAFIPLIAESRIIGKFMAYYDGPHIFSDEEADLAVTIARQLGFSIERMRADRGLRRAEDDLRRNEERLRSMFEHAGVGMVMKDEAGTISRVNPAFAAILGRSPEELAGASSFDFTHADDIAANRQAIAALHRGGGPVAFEKRYLAKNGQVVWARLTLSKGEDGEMLAVVENIDARKRAEQQVRESANQLALVTRTAPVLIAHCDAGRRFKFVNKPYAERFGHAPEACIGKQVAEVIGAEASNAIEGHIQAVLRGEPVEFEAEIPFPKIGHRFMHCSYAPEFDGDGAVVGWVAAITDISERKLDEEALRESEERFRAMFETTPECVKLVAPDGTLLHINSACLAAFGANCAEQLVGSCLYDYIAPEDREAFRAFNEMTRGGQKGSLEFDIIGLTGNRRHMETHAVPFRNPDGTTVQLAVTRDITERKQAAERLRESQAHLQLTTEAARVGTWQWDLKTGELFWSAILKQLWGYEPTADPLDYDAWLSRIDERDLTRVQEATDACVNGATHYDVEYRIRRQGETETRWIRSTGRANFNIAGDAVSMRGVSVDVTDHKRAEERLRRSEAEFRTLADNMHQFAWMTDAAGWVYWYNKRWFDYTGTTLEEMQGWGWQKVHHPDHLDRVVKKVKYCFDTGEPWEDTFPLRSKDGEYRWFLSRALPIRDEHGNVVRWFGTNTDITERLRADEQRIVLINELNHRVKNTLATVQAIAGQTLRDADLDGSVRDRFEARLIALSNAHNLLTEGNWEGAEIGQIIERALRPHVGAERFRLLGPPVRLSPKAAVAIAMGIHELATNAMKYGAFSNDTGRVSVTWAVDAAEASMLTMEWRESGGPVVSAPAKRGFGSRLIERNLAHDLDGEAKIDFRADGIVCTISSRLISILA
jgi:PAS domain S-box-containing protein